MSNEDRLDGSSATQLNLFSKHKAASLEKLPKNSESQPVIINFYSGNSSQKSDKVVQTDIELNRQSERGLQKYPAILLGSEVSTANINLETAEEVNSNDLVKNSGSLVSDDATESVLMEHRKHIDRHGTFYSRAQSDVERKKLEAELKAAEEIARIRQTVIEKRLAVELAALNEDPGTAPKYPRSPQSTSPDSLALEDIAMRKQSLMESNLTQDVENVDFQTRLVSSQTPPASSRQTSPTISPKLSAIKTELITSVLSSIRSLSLIDQKLNLDKKFSGSAGVFNPSSTGLPTYRPTSEQRYDPRERQLPDQRFDPRVAQIPEQRYDPRVSQLPDQRYDSRERPHSRKDDRGTPERHYRHECEYPYSPEPPKTPSIWRTAMAKIKRKMKSKSHSENWPE